MKKLINFFKENLHWFIVAGVALLCALFLIFGHVSENGKYITLDGSDAQIPESTKEFIAYSEKAMTAYITDENGEEVIVDVPTVESVDSETEQESGQGAYIYAPTDTYLNFKNYTLGKCWNTDGYYGAQCWDLGDLFWQNYAGRNLSTCGTGAAKGAWNCKEYNAGDEFELIYDKTQIKAGDWVIFSSGTYGHVGMALGSYNNGYVTLLGQNQGGGTCDGGGAATNIINISLASFSGAFRPKTYTEEPEPSVDPDPEPTPTSGDVSYTYVYGDSFGKVLQKLGLMDGWNNATVLYYTNQLIEQNMLDANGNVYVGKKFTLNVK